TPDVRNSVARRGAGLRRRRGAARSDLSSRAVGRERGARDRRCGGGGAPLRLRVSVLLSIGVDCVYNNVTRYGRVQKSGARTRLSSRSVGGARDSQPSLGPTMILSR